MRKLLAAVAIAGAVVAGTAGFAPAATAAPAPAVAPSAARPVAPSAVPVPSSIEARAVFGPFYSELECEIAGSIYFPYDPWLCLQGAYSDPWFWYLAVFDY